MSFSYKSSNVNRVAGRIGYLNVIALLQCNIMHFFEYVLNASMEQPTELYFSLLPGERPFPVTILPCFRNQCFSRQTCMSWPSNKVNVVGIAQTNQHAFVYQTRYTVGT